METRDGEDDASEESLVGDESVKTLHVFARLSLFVDQSVQGRPQPPPRLPPRGEDLIARLPRHRLSQLSVVEEVVVGPVVQRRAAVAPRFALEPDEERVSGRNEVVFLHGFGEGITESLDNFGIVGPGCVVQGEGFAAVTLDGLDG